MDSSDIKLIVELLPYYGVTSVRSKSAADRLVEHCECEENTTSLFRDVLGFNEGVFYRVLMMYGMAIEDAKKIESALNERCVALKFYRDHVQPAHDKFEAWKSRKNTPTSSTEILDIRQKIKDFEVKSADVGDSLVDYGYLENLLNKLESATCNYTYLRRLFNQKITASALHSKLTTLVRKLKTLQKPKRRSNVFY
jgi:hypothetical protein